MRRPTTPTRRSTASATMRCDAAAPGSPVSVNRCATTGPYRPSSSGSGSSPARASESSASTSGRYGTGEPTVLARPRAVTMSARAASTTASAASRVLPTPGSPVTKTAPPRPDRAAASVAATCPISASRPMSSPRLGWRPSGPVAVRNASSVKVGQKSVTGSSPYPRRAFLGAAGNDDTRGRPLPVAVRLGGLRRVVSSRRGCPRAPGGPGRASCTRDGPPAGTWP